MVFFFLPFGFSQLPDPDPTQRLHPIHRYTFCQSSAPLKLRHTTWVFVSIWRTHRITGLLAFTTIPLTFLLSLGSWGGGFPSPSAPSLHNGLHPNSFWAGQATAIGYPISFLYFICGKKWFLRLPNPQESYCGALIASAHSHTVSGLKSLQQICCPLASPFCLSQCTQPFLSLICVSLQVSHENKRVGGKVFHTSSSHKAVVPHCCLTPTKQLKIRGPWNPIHKYYWNSRMTYQKSYLKSFSILVNGNTWLLGPKILEPSFTPLFLLYFTFSYSRNPVGSVLKMCPESDHFSRFPLLHPPTHH